MAKTTGEAIGEALKSKKFLVWFSGTIVVLGQVLGWWNLTIEQFLAFLGLDATYIIGQGIADNGKYKK